MKVAVAMSGGVDSSLAAVLLKEQGHEVVGLTAWLWKCGVELHSTPKSCCGSVEAIKAARRAAEAAGAAHEVVDLSSEFERLVVEPTVRSYASGLTPNPCVLCNREVRIKGLLKTTRALGAELLATGHYARLETGQEGARRLKRGTDKRHDQSYFLFGVRPEDLGRVTFPLGEWTKESVRARLAELGHPAASRASSQDLCFAAGGGGLRRLLTERAPEALRPGPIYDLEGRALGEHRGIALFTIGQRRGLRVAAGRPLYVVSIRPEENAVMVGPAGALEARALRAEECLWLRRPPGREFRALVQVRYRTPPVPARVRLSGIGDGEIGSIHVEFETPVRAVAPGQAAVVYDGDEVLGGGWIARPSSRFPS